MTNTGEEGGHYVSTVFRYTCVKISLHLVLLLPLVHWDFKKSWLLCMQTLRKACFILKEFLFDSDLYYTLSDMHKM